MTTDRNTSIPPKDFGTLTASIQFLMEIDQLKLVERRTKLLNNQRFENSAEHSWHFAVGVMALAPLLADKPLDMLRVIEMALLHDIVEIDAGDVLIYDLAAREAIKEKEQAAAKRLFGLLPETLRDHFRQRWEEYEAQETAEARFAHVIDRLMPMLMNIFNHGQSWREHQIPLEQIVAMNQDIARDYPELWQHLLQHITPYYESENEDAIVSVSVAD